MKAWEKKKAFRIAVKQQVRSGNINRPDGTWGPGVDNAMKRDMIAGHRAGAKGR